MIKVFQLNTLELSDSKAKKLRELTAEYSRVAKLTLEIMKSKKPRGAMKLHELSYHRIRRNSKLPAQLVQTARREIWSKRKTIDQIGRLPVKFETRRACTFTQTRRANPIIALACLEKNKRIAIPIKQDGAFERFKEFLDAGWSAQSCQFVKGKIHVFLSKEFFKPEPTSTVLGVDVGSTTLAAVTLYSGDVLKQLYLGRDVAVRQFGFQTRRSSLQAKTNCRAKSSLNKLGGKQRNFVTTRCYQVAHEIVNLAKKFKASIAIEDLRHMRARRGRFRKAANRIINLIPYRKFLMAIFDVALCEGVLVEKVIARNTSRTCPCCRHVSKNSRRGRVFKCVSCGKTANADRIASLNIAKRLADKLAERFVQFSASGIAINRSVRSDDCHGL